jgi:hypothetical protein
MQVSFDTKGARANAMHSTCMMVDLPDGNTLFLHGEKDELEAFASNILAALLLRNTADAQPQEVQVEA